MLARVSVYSRNWGARRGTFRLWVFLLPSESIYNHEHRTQGRSPAKPPSCLSRVRAGSRDWWAELLDYSNGLKATRKPRLLPRAPGQSQRRYAERERSAA